MAVSAVTGVALGVAGVTALYHSARAVVILAAMVGKVFAKIEDSIRENSDHTKPRNSKAEDWKVEDFLPVDKRDWSKDWQTVVLNAAKTIVLATLFMYVINRFCPSVVTHANKLLHSAIPIQFTPDHIPLTRLAGL